MKFYIQDARSYAGDFILWWGPNNNGYTYDLDQAGVYDEEQARGIEALRGTDKAIPCDEALTGVVRAVNVEKMRKARP